MEPICIKYLDRKKFKKLKILFLSDAAPSTTFISQDIDLICNIHECLYIGFIRDDTKKHIKSKLIEYPLSSTKSRLKWRLEKLGLYFNWRDEKFSKTLHSAILEFKPDIIHCQFAYEASKFLHNVNLKTPTIINFRGYGASSKLSNKKYVKWLKEISLKQHIYPIFVSNSLRKNLEKSNIFFKNPGIVLYTGVNFVDFKRIELKYIPDSKIFLQVGTFNEKKGQEFTIRAFKKFLKESKEKNFQLHFIGDGKRLDFCKKLAYKLNIHDKVLFKGRLSKKEIIKELNCANYFVHHSVTGNDGDQEGVPNTIIEAMAMELPILSTDHSGIPEVIKNGVNGYICKEKDIVTYASQMKKITSWPLLPLNRKEAKDKFNIDKHINNLLNYYDKITNS